MMVFLVIVEQQEQHTFYSQKVEGTPTKLENQVELAVSMLMVGKSLYSLCYEHVDGNSHSSPAKLCSREPPRSCPGEL